MSLTATVEFQRKLSDRELINAINAMAPVQSCDIYMSEDGKRKTLQVKTKDFVARKDGRAVYIKGVTFKIPYKEKYTYYDEGRIEVKTRGVLGHPHVYHGEICWGSASLPIKDALRRNDFRSAVMLMCMWAGKPAFNDAYNKSYPYTALPVGWVHSTGFGRTRVRRIAHRFRNPLGRV